MHLTEEEGSIIDFVEEDVEGDLCLIGKVWVDSAIGKRNIEATMAQIWRLNLKAVFHEVGSNIFFIYFSIHVDKYRVDARRPCLFENNLFAIEQFDGFTLQRNMYHVGPITQHTSGGYEQTLWPIN